MKQSNGGAKQIVRLKQYLALLGVLPLALGTTGCMIPVPIPASIKVPEFSLRTGSGPGGISSVADQERARNARLLLEEDEKLQAQRLEALRLEEQLQARRLEMQQLEDQLQEQKQQALRNPKASGTPATSVADARRIEQQNAETARLSAQLSEAQKKLEEQRIAMQKLES